MSFKPLAPLVSGLLLAVSALVPGAWPLVFFALVPWFRFGSVGRFRDGYLFGLAFSLPMTFWLGQFVGRWTGVPAVGALAWLPAGLAMAVYFGGFSWLAGRSPAWAWPLLWAGIEVFRSYIPVLAFPWGLLAHPLADVPFAAQSAYLGTEYFTGAAILGFNLLLSRGRGDRPALAWTAAGLVATLFGTRMLAVPEGRFALAAAQPGVDVAYSGAGQADVLQAARVVADQASALLPRRSPHRLVVLPEGIAGRSPGNGWTFSPFGVTLGTDLIFGGQRGASPTYQTAFLASAAGFDGFDKTRLVIFGEFVPLRGVIPYPDSFRLPGGDLAAGTVAPRPLKASGYEVGPILCFEALFPDVSWRMAAAGADVLAVMSIDDWFAGTAAPRILGQASRWRAIENGLPLARAGTTGETAVLSPSGETLARVEGTGRGVAMATPPAGRNTTRPVLPLFPWAAFIVTLGMVFRRRGRMGDVLAATPGSDGDLFGGDVEPGHPRA